MKSSAFIIRIAICLLLSLVPLNELENRIYAARMTYRLHKGWSPNLVIVGIPSSDFNQPEKLKEIHQKIQSEHPSCILNGHSKHLQSLIVDSDDTVRRTHLHSKGTPSLGSLAYSALNLDLKYLKKLGAPHLIHFSGPPGTFPRCSYNHACPSFSGKKVILVEEGENEDIHHTPIGDMPRIEIAAHDIDTLTQQHSIHFLPPLFSLFINLGVILLGAFYIVYYPVLISSLAITGTGVVVCVGLFQLFFQVFDLYIPSANVILSLFTTYLVFTGYRLALQENLQWRSLKQAQYLRELDQMKTNFLSLVSHDFKTPLAKIQVIVERLRRELSLPIENRSDWKELLDSIENSNTEMKRFISSVLNLSRIESQKVILNKKTNDINLIIQQALKRLKPLAQAKNLIFCESLEPLFSIECDEDLMRQVLTNLIDNAIKYSPEGSKIMIRSKEEDGFVRVEVEDFGPGIPKDHLPLMFRKFSRFMQPIKEQVKGTGLGLYLSKYFIELHGGSIRLKSIEGRGTTFSFTLPLQEGSS